MVLLVEVSRREFGVREFPSVSRFKLPLTAAHADSKQLNSQNPHQLYKGASCNP